LEQPQSIRFRRVGDVLADSTQQIHSLRASGVISSQVASALGLAIKAAIKSTGKAWTTPPGIISSLATNDDIRLSL